MVDELLLEVAYKVEECPVCGKKEYKEENKHIKNRYSEEIARILKVDEEVLLDSIKNIRCPKCNLGYKNWWFKPEFYYKVFVQTVPSHPTGWDVVNGEYSKERFINEVVSLEKAIEKNDEININKHYRTILSLIENTPKAFIKERGFDDIVQKALEFDLKNMQRDEKEFLLNEVSKIIEKPKIFGRFTGYGGEYIKSMMDEIPNIKKYAEIGCPLWGVFPLFANDDVEMYFLKDEEQSFWGKHCSNDGVLCSEYVNKKYGVINTSVSELTSSNEKVDMLYMVHYLDHNGNPKELLEKMSKITKYLFIVNHIDKPFYRAIQHFTNLNDEVFKYLSSVLNFDIVSTLKNPKYSNHMDHGIIIKFN